MYTERHLQTFLVFLCLLKRKRQKKRFIRLNLDENLENLLQKYENHYKLLNRTDIVRMLLSEIDWIKENNKNQNTFKEVHQGSKFLDIEDEDEQFEFLKKNGF